MVSDLRHSKARVHKRVTSSGREFAAALFPSGRVVVNRRGELYIYQNEDRCPLEEDGPQKPANTRPGVLYRHEDQSGVSGTGVVADFVRFPDGSVVQEWRNEANPNLDAEKRDSGIDFRPSMSIAVQIHGHKGRTEYIYDNGEVVQP